MEKDWFPVYIELLVGGLIPHLFYLFTFLIPTGI